MLKLLSKSNSLILTRSFSSNLTPIPQYKKLSEGTSEDFKLSQIHFAQHGSPEAIAKRILGISSTLS